MDKEIWYKAEMNYLLEGSGSCMLTSVGWGEGKRGVVEALVAVDASDLGRIAAVLETGAAADAEIEVEVKTDVEAAAEFIESTDS